MGVPPLCLCPGADPIPPQRLAPWGCVLPGPMALGPPPEEGTVAVVVRVRPPNPCEREGAAHAVLHVVDQHILVFDPEEPSGPPGTALPGRGAKHRGKDLKFVFDRVFGEGATQEEVFQHTTREVLDGVLNGYNCSGKARPAPPPRLLPPGWAQQGQDAALVLPVTTRGRPQGGRWLLLSSHTCFFGANGMPQAVAMSWGWLEVWAGVFLAQKC